jgi:hypothetical protein
LKTRIVEVPRPLEYAWAPELRHLWKDRAGSTVDEDKVLLLFERAFQLFKDGVNDHVLAFVIGLVKRAALFGRALKVYEQLLLQSLRIEPAVLPLVIDELLKYHASHELDRTSIAKSLNDHLVRHAPSANTHELAWALWGMQAFGLKPDSDAWDSVAATKDSVVAAIAIALSQRGVLGRAIPISEWGELLQAESLLDESWISAYQAGVSTHRLLGALRRAAWPEPFSSMRKAGVDFLSGLWGRPKEGVHVTYDYNDDSDSWMDADKEDDDDLGEDE